MRFDNLWFVAAILGVVAWFHVKLIAEVLNAARLSSEVPEPVRNAVTEKDQARACRYVTACARFSVIQDTASLAALLAFWWLGGFGWLAVSVEHLGLGAIPGGLVYLGCIAIASGLLSLPFEWWETFGIEAEFGLNRTSLGTFIWDRLKGLLVMTVIGGLLGAAVLWLFIHVQAAAFWAWLITALFGLFMSWVAPKYLLPIYMKFTPMEDSALKTAIVSMAARLDFPVSEIYVVDGSKRSTKANAFFTGFGRNRRIALFDTLVDGHSTEEILAILAHEIGHAKLGHVPSLMVAGLIQSAVTFGLLGLAFQDQRLYDAFLVQPTNVAVGFVLFGVIWKPWSVFLDVAMGALTRKHEFEADAFAKRACGGGEALASALKRLSRDHLNHLTPHPFYVVLHHSHPPVLERLKALG